VLGVTESQLMDLMQSLVESFPDARLFSLPRLGETFQIELGFRGHGDLEAPMQALVRGLSALGVAFEALDEE
jgi:hypothetical protein